MPHIPRGIAPQNEKLFLNLGSIDTGGLSKVPLIGLASALHARGKNAVVSGSFA